MKAQLFYGYKRGPSYHPVECDHTQSAQPNQTIGISLSNGESLICYDIRKDSVDVYNGHPSEIPHVVNPAWCVEIEVPDDLARFAQGVDRENVDEFAVKWIDFLVARRYLVEHP